MLEALSIAEENYLKTIYILIERDQSQETVSTNAIAARLGTAAPSVSDMLRRLSDKGLLAYEKYKGVSLSPSGKTLATQLIRRHRLWETFLVDKLQFAWDEVHPLAEQLEHIQSDELINRLEAFLGFPRFDPHGDPIPDQHGQFAFRQQVLLSQLNVGQSAVIVGVNEHSPDFLRYVDQLQLAIGTHIQVLEKYPFDNSTRLLLNHESEKTITFKVCHNLFANTLPSPPSS